MTFRGKERRKKGHYDLSKAKLTDRNELFGRTKRKILNVRGVKKCFASNQLVE